MIGDMTGGSEAGYERRYGSANMEPPVQRVPRAAGKSSPGIGLALGGGGVRGLAHIGVLRALLEVGTPIRAIAGTSIGAAVAAAFAFNSRSDLGRLLEDLQRLRLAPPSLLRKPGGGFSLSVLFQSLGFARRLMRSNARGWSIVKGAELADYFLRLSAGKRLEDAPIPLAVVTTDLNTGEPVVLTSGSAALAIQASCALPGFFAPVSTGGHLLADGGFVNMVPADVVRTMGVDKVIAVDVGQDHFIAEIHNGLEALSRAMEICARHHKRFHLKAADLVIRPEFGQAVPALDFTKARHCIRAGIRAGKRSLRSVLALASEGQHATCTCTGGCACGLRGPQDPREDRREP